MQRLVFPVGLLVFIGISVLFVLGCRDQESPHVPDSDVSTPISELDIKAHLVEKYNPGISFGMPIVLPDDLIVRVIKQNPELVQYIRKHFQIDSAHALYKKIMQFNEIVLEKSDSDEIYTFLFRDGRGCLITTYRGIVTIKDSKIEDEITEKTVENVPC